MTESNPLLGPNDDPSSTDHKSLLNRLFPRPRRGTTPSADSDDEAARTELTEQDSDTRLAKGHRQRCFECCQGWYQYICLSKWYKWTAYYIPILEWLPSYKLKYILGDVFAGLTLASISIPMSLSYAASLAKIEPINGLYATIAAPIVYALLGKTRRLAVLPEAALSLVVGEAIRRNIEENTGEDHPHLAKSSEMACMITFLAALITFFAGIFRLGFVDVIGSPPLIRGFISGVAIVIFTEQLITELGLEDIAKTAGYAHSSAWEKAKFVYHHLYDAHRLTFLISITAFLTLVIAKYLKESIGQRRFKKNWVTLIPDILGVVAFSACSLPHHLLPRDSKLTVVLTWYFNWDKSGVKVLGQVESGSFQIRFPIPLKDLRAGKSNIRPLISSAFVVAILGFFESMAAVQYLSTADNDVSKPNRELVALGAVNGVVSFLPGLPVYGGLARSKINEYSGSRTLLSGVSLAVFTFLAAQYLLTPLAWLPKASLSAVISTVSLGLLGEAPKDFKYYWSMRAWTELAMICIVITFTVFWSIDVGIYVGIGLSLLLLVKSAGNYSLRPLKLDRERQTGFVVTDDENYDFYPFVLMVNIATDSLTFVNTARIKEGLDRLERYGEFDVHPSEDRKRNPEDNVNVVFDFSLVTDIDPSAMQVLIEIVRGYRVKHTEVYFVGLIHDSLKEVFTRAKIFRLLGDEHVASTVEECIGFIHLHGGNHDEAARRARAEGRSIDAELNRWKNLALVHRMGDS